MNTAKELYDRWLAQPELDTAVAEELHGIAGDDAAITDRFYRDLEFGTGGLRGVLARELGEIDGKEDQIVDAFYRDLEFGTGGLRGVIGAGTNRMNL